MIYPFVHPTDFILVKILYFYFSEKSRYLQTSLFQKNNRKCEKGDFTTEFPVLNLVIFIKSSPTLCCCFFAKTRKNGTFFQQNLFQILLSILRWAEGIWNKFPTNIEKCVNKKELGGGGEATDGFLSTFYIKSCYWGSLRGWNPLNSVVFVTFFKK